MTTPPALAADLARVQDALHAAAAALSDADDIALVDALGDAARALRWGRLAGGRDAFAARFAGVPTDRLYHVARYYADLAHLMNVVEEQQRIRVLRTRATSAVDGITAGVRDLAAAGLGPDAVRALFARALIMPVLTAHPTESRRRSVLDHLGVVARALDNLADPAEDIRAAADGRLAAAVFALHATEGARAHRPSVVDEIDAAIEVFRRNLLDITPVLYRKLEAAFAAAWPDAPPAVPPLLVWGSWVGGDRDGNPNVTARVTRAAFDRQRAIALDRHLADVAELGRTLSCSNRYAPHPSQRLADDLARERRELPEVAALAQPRLVNEPWREKLLYIAARLRATIARQDGRYAGWAEYAADLALIDATLREAGYAALTTGVLADCRRRVDVFGFHLASLDIRQHSGVHEQAVDEVLALRGRPGYRALADDDRRALLETLLDQPLPPLRDRAGLSPATADLFATLDVVGRARRELGARACERWVISFTTDVSDLLEVAFLARSAGLAIGELRPVPLLEQLADLRRAGPIADAIAASPALRAELGDELEVMIGYSDSGKQIGYVAAAAALRDAQCALAVAARRAGMVLTVFHGRGGAIGRGGGPASQAIRAQPREAVGGRFRVTEQGETITARYARPEIAVRDLELTIGAVLAVSSPEAASTCNDDLVGVAAAAALVAYQKLVGDERALAAFTLAATPIEYVANLPIGSRPSSRARSAAFTLADLRAIPWVFSWTQCRAGIPGWYGVGSGFAALIERSGIDGVRAAVAESPFLKSLVMNAELALVRADIEVFAYYARLADPELAPLYELIRAEHALTERVLDDLRGHKPLADRIHIADSVHRRNVVLDVLCHTQIELMRRARAAPDVDDVAGREAVFETIAGIAAALQTSG